MDTLLHHIALASPLFALVLVGYLVMRLTRWPDEIADSLTKFVFAVALPAMMFKTMSGMRQLPPVDIRLLIAFFGSCIIVFILGRLFAWKVFGLDGAGQTVFALGGVFSNNLMLGLPLAKSLIGEAALPSVALVLVFNAMTMWTMATISIEWARHGSFSLKGFTLTAKNVLMNPLILAIIFGTAIRMSGLTLPAMIDTPLTMMAQMTAPLSLIALGMSLVHYGIRTGWRISLAITFIKLLVQPFAVWLLAQLLNLPAMETQVVVLLGSVALGINVYIIARQFRSLEGPTASSLVLSTVLSAVTTPLVMTLISV